MGHQESESKEDFFFVKKKQKTFVSWGGGCDAAEAQDRANKSFLVLFYKKEPFFPKPTAPAAPPPR
jgi:hypothetical protein